MKSGKRLVRCPMSPDAMKKIEREAERLGLRTGPYCVKLAMAAIDNEKVIRGLSPYFRHGYVFNNQIFMGNARGTEKGALDALMPERLTDQRLPVKFNDTEDEFGRLHYLAGALETSWSRALTLLVLEAQLHGIQPETNQKGA